MVKKRSAYIVAMALSALIFLASCGRDEAEVIPRDDMSRIYAEMLLTDQWIINTPNIRLIADTSLVYAPIFEKYGYDTDDYRKSVDHYMDDPERLARIFRKTGDILDAKIADLEKIKAERQRVENRRIMAERFRPDIKWEEVYRDTIYSGIGLYLEQMYIRDTVSEENADTVHVEPVDTLMQMVPDSLVLSGLPGVNMADTLKMMTTDEVK